MGMSASSLCYRPAPDRNGDLREQIVGWSPSSTLWGGHDLLETAPTESEGQPQTS